MDIFNLSATSLARHIKNNKISVMEVLDEVLDNIEKNEKKINAYISLEDEKKLKSKAIDIDNKIRNNTIKSPLAGIPISIKDNISTRGLRTSCGSKMLKNYIAPYDAFVVEKIKESGMIIVGKTNMDEFAMGNTTETSFYGPTKNPLNLEYVPGGSSGGSASSVAANEAFVSLASDTGGSIRQPAAFCGLVGLKPTYGTVSRNGLIAYCSSFDQIGPIGKDIEDCLNMYNIISGKDKKDSTSIGSKKVDISQIDKSDIKGMRIGIPKKYFNKFLNEKVSKAVLEAGKRLEERGAILEEFDLDFMDYIVPTYYIISCAQASSNLERYDGVKYGYRHESYDDLHDMYKKSRNEGFGEEVKRRILLGSFVLSSGYYDEYYLKALKVRRLLKEEFDKAFSKYDLILSPVYPDKVPKLGESLVDPLKNYMNDIYTVSANLLGIPAISMAFEKDENGLPIGLQFMANSFEEDKLFLAGKVLGDCY